MKLPVFITLIILATLSSNAVYAWPSASDMCSGQCGITDSSFELRARDRQRRSLNVQFIDGFFHVTGSDGVTRRFPYQDAARAQEAAFDIANNMSERTTSGDDVFQLIPDYFNTMTFNGPRTIQNIRRQNLLRERQRIYCQGSDVHADLTSFCTNFGTHDQSITQDLQESLTLLQGRKSNCLDTPVTATNMRSIFDILSRAMAAENMDINDSYCNATTGMMGLLLNQMGMVQGEDYIITHGANHVFMSVPNSDDIIDPTYLQFINRDCPIYQQLQATPGFLGTRQELKQFFIENKSCFRPLTPQARRSLARKRDNESWWAEVERLYYGTDTSNTGYGNLAQSSLLYNENTLANNTFHEGGSIDVLIKNLASRLSACNNETAAILSLRCHQQPFTEAQRLINDALAIRHRLHAPAR